MTRITYTFSAQVDQRAHFLKASVMP